MTDNGSMIPDDELISAYHDGELNEVDRARAERLLSTDPERRRELAELQALSRRVRSLPSQSLGDTFAAEVLRRAERDMLVPVPAESSSGGGSRLPLGRGFGWLPSRRGLMWAGAALAASVLILLLGPGSEHELTVMSTPPAETVTLNTADHSTVGLSLSADSTPPRSESTTNALNRQSNLPGSAPELQLGVALDGAARGEQLAELDVAARLETYGFATPVNRHLAQQAVAVEMLNAETPVDPSLLVVEVDIERQQLWADPFAQVLLDNGVQSATLPQVQRANLDNNLYQSQVARRNLSRDVQQSLTLGDTDLVYVVAEPSQLQAAITQLQAGRNTYRRVSITTAANGFAKNQAGVNEELRAGDKVGAGMRPEIERRTPPRARLGDPQVTDLKPDALQRKTTDADHDLSLKDAGKASATAAPATKRESQPSAEPLDVTQKANANGELAKMSAESLARNSWFGRLTLPPADAPQLQNMYYAYDQRGVSPARTAGSTGASGGAAVSAPQLPVAPGSPPPSEMPNASKPQSGVAVKAVEVPEPPAVATPVETARQPMKESTVRELEKDRALAEKKQLQAPIVAQPQAAADKSSPTGDQKVVAHPATLQRALFVFRVVDSPAATPPAATAAPVAVPAATTPPSKPPSSPAQPPDTKKPAPVTPAPVPEEKKKP